MTALFICLTWLTNCDEQLLLQASLAAFWCCFRVYHLPNVCFPIYTMWLEKRFGEVWFLLLWITSHGFWTGYLLVIFLYEHLALKPLKCLLGLNVSCLSFAKWSCNLTIWRFLRTEFFNRYVGHSLCCIFRSPMCSGILWVNSWSD